MQPEFAIAKISRVDEYHGTEIGSNAVLQGTLMSFSTYWSTVCLVQFQEPQHLHIPSQRRWIRFYFKIQVLNPFRGASVEYSRCLCGTVRLNFETRGLEPPYSQSWPHIKKSRILEHVLRSLRPVSFVKSFLSRSSEYRPYLAHQSSSNTARAGRPSLNTSTSTSRSTMLWFGIVSQSNSSVVYDLKMTDSSEKYKVARLSISQILFCISQPVIRSPVASSQ